MLGVIVWEVIKPRVSTSPIMLKKTMVLLYLDKPCSPIIKLKATENGIPPINSSLPSTCNLQIGSENKNNVTPRTIVNSFNLLFLLKIACKKSRIIANQSKAGSA